MSAWRGFMPAAPTSTMRLMEAGYMAAISAASQPPMEKPRTGRGPSPWSSMNQR